MLQLGMVRWGTPLKGASIIGSVLLLFVFGCGSTNQDAEVNSHSYVLTNKEKTSESFPLAPIPLSPKLKMALASAKTLPELLQTEFLISLENSDESVIGMPLQILWVKEHWVILDNIRETILTFKEDGTFVGVLGRKGEGPGEYSRPALLEKCFDDQIGVYDSNRGVIHLYGVTGGYNFSTKQYSGDQRFIPVFNFIWNQSDRLFLSRFATTNGRAPRHVLLQMQGTEFKALWGFGERNGTNVRNYGDRIIWNCFEEIDGRIWSAPPYDTIIDIFDSETRHLGTLKARPRDEMINPKDFMQDSRVEMDHLTHNLEFLHVGDLVFVNLKHSIDVYDIHGNILRSGLKRGSMHFPSTVYTKGNTTYAVSRLIPQADWDKIDPRDVELLKKAGCTPETADDENAFLRVARLVQ